MLQFFFIRIYIVLVCNNLSLIYLLLLLKLILHLLIRKRLSLLIIIIIMLAFTITVINFFFKGLRFLLIISSLIHIKTIFIIRLWILLNKLIIVDQRYLIRIRMNYLLLLIKITIIYDTL